MAQVNTPIADPASVQTAINSRFSVRAFLPKPVPRELLQTLLTLAARAPSGSNAQPWKVYVLQGASRDALVEKACAAHQTLADHPELDTKFRPDYDYNPRHWVEPYLGRRRENGWALYHLLGIQRGERERIHAQQQRNFRFFDAPVGIFFTLDRVLGEGRLIDVGMFAQTLMLAARAYGLHTCAQASWNDFASLVLEHIGASAEEILVCGMALGWADEAAQVNQFHTPREGVESFTHWLD